MPFATHALIPLVQNGGFTMWLYRSDDLRAEVATPGYFNPAAARLRAW